MNKYKAHIDHCFKTLNDTISSNGATDILESLKSIATVCPNKVFIADMERGKICYANDVAKVFFDIREDIEKDGYSFAKNHIHPDYNLLRISFFSYYENTENYNKQFEHIYYVKTVEDWRWLYFVGKIVSFNSEGKPKYFLLIFVDVVNEILEENKPIEQQQQENLSDNHIKFENYISLSKREKEILKYISQDLSTNDIAKKLFLSKSSIDASRKNMLKKLGVNNGIGLAKYAILFGEEE